MYSAMARLIKRLWAGPHACGALGATLVCLALSAPVCAQQSADAPTSPAQRIELQGTRIEVSQQAKLPAHIVPPLSIRQSCMMLRDTIEYLERMPEKPARPTLEYFDRILHAVTLYVESVDRAHPTLPYYKWEEILSQKIKEDHWRIYEIELKQPLARVNALALRAHHGDVEISFIAAVDENQTEWEFNQAIKVTGGQSRTEICYLPLPTRLKRIRLTCRHADEDPHLPRLFIEAGRCSRPESAKQARYYIQLARNDFKQETPRAAAGWLRKAFDSLIEFQRTRRL
jgi:hypothetical protein